MGILQLINYSSPIVILIYLTKVLSTENYGFIALSISITQYSVVLMDYGFGIYATKLVSMYFRDKNKINEILGSVLIIKFIIFLLISLVLSMILLCFESKINSYIFFLSLIPIFFQGLNVEWFFLGIEKMKVITINVLIGRLLIVFLTLLLIKKNNQYIFFPLITGFGQLIIFSMYIIQIYKNGYWLKFPSKYIFNDLLKNSFTFFLSRLSVITYTNGGTIFLGYFGNTYQVGIFSISEQIYKAIQTIITPISQALYPFLVKEKKIRIWLKLVAVSLFFSSLLCILLFIFFPLIFRIFFEPKYLKSIELLNIFLIAIPLHILNVLMGYPLSAIYGKESSTNKTVFFGVFIFLLSIFSLVISKNISTINLAIISVIVEFSVLGLRIVQFFNFKRKNL